jgi:hypothetical protein
MAPAFIFKLTMQEKSEIINEEDKVQSDNEGYLPTNF